MATQAVTDLRITVAAAGIHPGHLVVMVMVIETINTAMATTVRIDRHRGVILAKCNRAIVMGRNIAIARYVSSRFNARGKSRIGTRPCARSVHLQPHRQCANAANHRH